MPDPQALRIVTTLNGDVVQDGDTADMIFSVRDIIAHLSQDTTLPAGTVLLTGTPSGVGPENTAPLLRGGDSVEVSIDQVGRLNNYVVQRKN